MTDDGIEFRWNDRFGSDWRATLLHDDNRVIYRINCDYCNSEATAYYVGKYL